MKIAGISDVGKVRPNNEDNVAFSYLEDAVYAIVCDGMGGAVSGEEASSIAVETIQEKIQAAYSPKMNAAALERMLVSSITAANFKIYDYAVKNEKQGMGTTAVVAIMKPNFVVIGYDGDSRAYLVHDTIRQLTSDHTFLNELYRLGKITKEEMEADPRKNIITRALGVGEDIEVDTLCEDIVPGDTVLLCSDGLTNCLNDENILELIQSRTTDNAVKVLIDKANENGGVDNITAALLFNEEV